MDGFNIPQYQIINKSVNPNSSKRIPALSSFMIYFEFSQWNFVPNYNTVLLDLVVSNILCQVDKAHDMLLYEYPALDVTLQLKIININNDVVNDFPIYNFRKDDFRLLYDSTLHCNWSSLENVNEVNAACAEFYRLVYNIMYTSVPKYIPAAINFNMLLGLTSKLFKISR